MRQAGIVLVLLALAACADDAARWTKPGASPAMASTELDRCQREARDTTRHEDQINADILASRGSDWQRNGTLSVQEADLAASSRGQGNRALAACMTAKGYSPAQ
jgi:hypothetical protein